MLRKGTVIAFIAGMVTATAGTAVAQQIGIGRFPDVAPQQYFYSAVNRFARAGLLTGYNSGYFGPNDTVTRGQMAVILDRYDKKMIDPIRKEIGMAVTEEDTEPACTGGYTLGQTFPSNDGCNTCTCTQTGIACTERACPVQKCFSSQECSPDKICSIEQGDCRFPCPQGAVCIQPCAGICLPRTDSQKPYCGDGMCNGNESAQPPRTGSSTYCPQDCKEQGPVCGNDICEDGEEDAFTLGEDGSVLQNRGTCPDDCIGETLSSCERQKKDIDALFEKSRSCEEDADCTVFKRGCSPYLTCGKAVSLEGFLSVSASVLEYVESCEDAEPPMCAGCIEQTAVCRDNVCVLTEGE